MKIHLDSVRSGPYDWKESLAFAPAEMGCDPASELSPIAVRGRLSETDPDLWLDLDIEFRVTQPCDRCGKPAAADVRAVSRLLVVRRKGSGRREVGGELELSADDLGMLEVVGGEFESEPLVAEQVQLEMPRRPLCRDDCRGLCPRCGGDRNERDCDCEREAGDPRWSALAELKGRLDAPN